MSDTNSVEYDGCDEHKNRRYGKTYNRVIIDSVEKCRKVIDVQILGRIDIRHQQTGCSDYYCEYKQKQYGLIKGI